MNQSTSYYEFEKNSTDLVLQRPVPKPRKIIKNKILNEQSQLTNHILKKQNDFEKSKNNSNNILLKSSSISFKIAQNIIPPPLPPRNVFVTLPSPVTDICIDDQKNLSQFTVCKTNNLNENLNFLNSKNFDFLNKVDEVQKNSQKNLFISLENNDLIKDLTSNKIENKIVENNNLIKTDECNNDLQNFNSFNNNVENSLQNYFDNTCSLNQNLTDEELKLEPKCKSVGEYICFSGWVRITYVLQNHSTKKILDKRCFAIIKSNLLSFAENDETTAIFFGSFDLYKAIYIGRDSENKLEVVLMLREAILILNAKNHPWNCIKFVPEDNLEYWLVFLAKCLNSQLSIVQKNLENMDVCGKLWIKEGISGIWSEGWAKIVDRKFYYWAYENKEIICINIRKIILIKKDLLVSDFCDQIENSLTGPILIVLDGSSLYLQGEWDLCTKHWFDYITAELKCNTYLLEDNRLTNDDVPVIVDKCIRLVSTYGLYQLGIYRRNGSAVVAKDLLKEFREDPYNVCMELITEERINAVADVLRSFFRQLDSPLIPEKFQEDLFRIAESTFTQTEKIECYRNVIKKFPKIYFSTLKKLLAHLQQVTTHSDKNLATVDNISKIFGPTIFSVNKCDEPVSIKSYEKTSRQILVMCELLNNFDNIFETSDAEKNAKLKLDKIQEKKNSKARAEGFLVPIHLFQKDNKCFNVQCDCSALQVVSFKIEKFLLTSEISFCESYALFEVIKNGQLERRLGDNEILKQIVLGRWLEWEDIASSCYLLFKKDNYLFDPQNAKPFADDIKIAEPGSKSFKTGQLKIEFGTQIALYNKAMKIQNKWCVDEMLWFTGSENERKAPYPYTLTFIITKKDLATCTKYKNKFFGYCVAFQNKNQRTQWLNSVILCKQEYLPTPLIQV